MTETLDLLGLVWHEKVDTCDEIEILGVIVDGRRGLVRAKPSRAWRLWCGVGALLRRRRAAGWQVLAVVGHFVSLPARETVSERVPRHV